MNDQQRTSLRRATQQARALLEREFSEQLEGRFDIRPDGTIPDEPGAHLNAPGRLLRGKLVAAIEHRQAGGKGAADAVAGFLREAAFTTLNRFVALKMLEERSVVKACVSNGQQSSGFKEFTMLAPGLSELPDGGYRLYLESLFDEVGREVRVLFDRRAVAGWLWPRRQALYELLDVLNQDALDGTWQEAEAIGWVYQYFNSKDERQAMREASSTPRTSYELAVRNQFFTPHYVVQFLTDNTLGRTWHEMRRGETRLHQTCDYFAERPGEVFLSEGEAPSKSSATPTNGQASDDRAEDEPTYVPHRPQKDPRDLRVLDPACGSGHFLLYAFELLIPIYEEAWEDADAPASEATGRTLRADYDSLGDLRRALPQLILKHNLFGIDIDGRAAQIAAFALWMRAQEAYNDFGIPAAERAPITKTGVVVAEPMPGEEALREEFAASLESDALRPFVEAIFAQMELADEAGPLLRIEEEIRTAVREAKRQWVTDPKQLELIPEAVPQQAKQGGLFDPTSVSDEAFWDSIEERIYEALQRYVRRRGAETDGMRRRLFAGDAAAGFAFIDVCRQRYDVVLMNPPFGEPAESTKSYIGEQYPNSKSDILQAFVERAEELLTPAGYLGAITSRTSFFLSTAQSWRERVVLRRYRPHLLADFGHGVLDAMVETAAYVFRSLNETEEHALTQSLLPDLERAETNAKDKFSVPKYMEARADEDLKRHQAERELKQLLAAGLIADASGRYPQYTRRAGAIRQLKEEELNTTARPPLTCFRLLEADDKGHALYEAVQNTGDARRFRANPATFADVPGAPFAYWVSDRVRRLFQELPPFESNERFAENGVQTSDDFRFVRCWWEVDSKEVCPPEAHPDGWDRPYCVCGSRWFPFAKGGAFSPFCAETHLVLNWHKSGQQIKEYVVDRYPYLNGNPGYVVKDRGHYFRPGLTFSSRARRFSTKPIPQGVVFSHTGLMLFAKPDDLQWLSTYLSSNIMRSILGLLAPPRKNETTYVQQLPTPASIDADKAENLSRAREVGIRESQHRMAMEPTNLGFQRPIQLANRGGSETYPESEVDDLVRDVLGLSESEKQGLLGELGVVTGLASDRERFSANGQAGDEEEDRALQPEKKPDEQAHDLASYALGCAFGRWDVRCATGEHEVPALPDPFDPLPVCPPGMLTGADDLPLREAPEGYPLDLPADGILVDDPGHDRDVLGRMRTALELFFEDEAAAEREACELLGEEDLRSYFRKNTGFFEAHRKQYSKSRRKAPIYWQLAVPSARYSIWLYYPKLTPDTFYRVLDIASEKVRHEEHVLSQRTQEAGETPSASQRDAIADQEDFVTELRAFRQEIERIAPLWKPDLNDGVVINFAPLWRLVGHHTAWQKECKKHWDRLVEGEYDWAHWAMHLWPERVVTKCAERRDLAIAHGLEEVFWKQDAGGDWHARETPTQPVEELVAARSSRTVQAARDDLVAA